MLFADFNWENVEKLAGKKKIKVTELPKFPAVKRDLALLLNKEVSFKEIYKLSFQSEKTVLKEVDLFDVYEGGKLPEGNKIMKKLQATFEKNLEAVLR